MLRSGEVCEGGKRISEDVKETTCTGTSHVCTWKLTRTQDAEAEHGSSNRMTFRHCDWLPDRHEVLISNVRSSGRAGQVCSRNDAIRIFARPQLLRYGRLKHKEGALMALVK